MELEELEVPFLIVCGERVNHPRVVFQEARGKWDAINFGAQFVTEEADIIVLNDVDTRIHNLHHAFLRMNEKVDLVYCRVKVPRGPQVKFYRILDPIRRKLHVAASGELMLMKREVFERVMPIPPCVAEDSYILFKALEFGYKAYFSSRAYVTTERTADADDEEGYKARTTYGIYQALGYTNPSLLIKAFYVLLPAFVFLLILAGKDGRGWVKGIEKAVKGYVTKRNLTRF